MNIEFQFSQTCGLWWGVRTSSNTTYLKRASLFCSKLLYLGAWTWSIQHLNHPEQVTKKILSCDDPQKFNFLFGGWASLIGLSKNKCDQTLGTPKINVLLSLSFGCLHSRALGKGHGVKYGGVCSMEWEAIGNTSGTWGNWEHQQINFANLVGTNWEPYMQHIGHMKSQNNMSSLPTLPATQNENNWTFWVTTTSPHLVPRIYIPTYLHYHFLAQLYGRDMNCGDVVYHPYMVLLCHPSLGWFWGKICTHIWVFLKNPYRWFVTYP